jgi:mannose-6-phosphate isomerase-like protein (cupin superfamily)
MEKYSEERPWGNFVQFCHNETCTVKIITINPGQALSLQYHNKRDEFWKVISGKGQIVVGEKSSDAKIGDEFFIQKGEKHRMMTIDSEMKVMEISFGQFDEDDIVRLEDIYQRK